MPPHVLPAIGSPLADVSPDRANQLAARGAFHFMQTGVELAGRIPQCVSPRLLNVARGLVKRSCIRIRACVDECRISLMLPDELERYGTVANSPASSSPGISTPATNAKARMTTSTARPPAVRRGPKSWENEGS